nr:MAG TPA: hypothetical protein [Bacteriophage sp.]
MICPRTTRVRISILFCNLRVLCLLYGCILQDWRL